MKKRIIYSVILLFAAITAYSQQNPMFTQYMFNGVAINPAYAGSHDVLSLIALYRNQWVNIEGAPKTTTLTADAQLPNEKIGLALSVYNDKIGVTNNFGAYSCYSYRLKFKKFILALGFSAGINQIAADFGNMDLSDNKPDPAFAQNISQLTPNFGAGVYLYSEKYYFGFSIPQLASNNIFGGDVSNQFSTAKHFFITSGYVFAVNQDIKIRPSVFLKIVSAASPEVDFNTNVWFYDRFAVGVSYRTFDSFDALLEVKVNRQISIGYAHDFTITELRKYSSGTHEIMLRYDFAFDKTKVVTPRYF